jgi:hypothetical protein
MKIKSPTAGIFCWTLGSTKDGCEVKGDLLVSQRTLQKVFDPLEQGDTTLFNTKVQRFVHQIWLNIIIDGVEVLERLEQH